VEFNLRAFMMWNSVAQTILWFIISCILVNRSFNLIGIFAVLFHLLKTISGVPCGYSLQHSDKELVQHFANWHPKCISRSGLIQQTEGSLCSQGGFSLLYIEAYRARDFLSKFCLSCADCGVCELSRSMYLPVG
jgi:hypothetical protein